VSKNSVSPTGELGTRGVHFPSEFGFLQNENIAKVMVGAGIFHTVRSPLKRWAASAQG
jgi:hypothetical protein